ncbi:hypothetical protein P154DRAFT_620564 [Amniculicola lignicola CBS 123094]|uniref:Ent-kaurene synthase n=1 Tax=Amniculicola lignicola CBS 123094 TaxID=1392246 RepID=A0A6A5WEH1_9PLEO|nr:hypothetical protein P154DRAFT_620564 [Amniculicola lignicola CBS 123094]
MSFTISCVQMCPSTNEIIADIGALSVITKEDQGQAHILFPECFEYLLAEQQKSRVWGSNSAQIDIILNSLAGLLALATRQRTASPQSPQSSSLHARIEGGQAALQTDLQNWAVQDSTVNHFRTYHQEGSPSFSANCNVLPALLGEAEEGLDQEDIEKALAFLLELEESGPIHGKWNIPAQYSRMLFVQVSVLILEQHNVGHVEKLASKSFPERIIGAICRLMSQTLSKQRYDGSWDGSLEVTSYSIITAGYALSLPWGAAVKDYLRDSIRQGRDYVQAKYSHLDNTYFLWIEKVSYRSLLLHSVYCSAAPHLHIIDATWAPFIVDGFTLPQGNLKKTQYLISNLPLFQGVHFASLELVLVEAQLMTAQLKSFRNSLFNRSDIPMTVEKYLGAISMIWVTCNHKNNRGLSYKTMWEMVLLSLFNLQVDEYMESVVARMPQADISLLMDHLKYQSKLASMAATNPSPKFANGSVQADVDPYSGLLKDTPVHGAFKALSLFMQQVTQHSSLTRSPATVQQEMALEI